VTPTPVFHTNSILIATPQASCLQPFANRADAKGARQLKPRRATVKLQEAAFH